MEAENDLESNKQIQKVIMINREITHKSKNSINVANMT